jgi:hypothetical protein
MPWPHLCHTKGRIPAGHACYILSPKGKYLLFTSVGSVPICSSVLVVAIPPPPRPKTHRSNCTVVPRKLDRYKLLRPKVHFSVHESHRWAVNRGHSLKPYFPKAGRVSILLSFRPHLYLPVVSSLECSVHRPSEP